MKYIYTRIERLILESVIKFDPELKDKLDYVYSTADEHLRDYIDDIINVEEVEHKKLNKDEYTVSLSDKPGMFRMGGNDIKVGRLFNILNKNGDDLKLEIATRRWNVFNSNFEGDFTIEDRYLQSFFDEDKFSSNAKSGNEYGSLGSSCMNQHCDIPSFFDLCEENKNIKLLVLTNNEEKIDGRAFIYYNVTKKDSEETFTIMNTVYGAKKEHEMMFEKYAKDNGIISVEGLSENERNKYKIHLEHVDFQDYPWMDSFDYLNKTQNTLTSWAYSESEDDVIIQLRDQHGAYRVIANAEEKVTLDDVLDGYEEIAHHIRLETLVNHGFDDSFSDSMRSEMQNGINDTIESYISSNEIVDELRKVFDKKESESEDEIYWIDFIVPIALAFGQEISQESDGYDIIQTIEDYDEVEMSVELLSKLFNKPESDFVGMDNDELISKVNKILTTRESFSKVIKAMIDIDMIDEDDIESHIEDSFPDIFGSNYALVDEIADVYSKDKFEDMEPFDIIENQYGQVTYIDEIQHYMNEYWRESTFIQSVKESGYEEEYINMLKPDGDGEDEY
jgi:hypothetical protein